MICGVKKFVLICFIIMLPAYSSEFDYSNYRNNTSIQKEFADYMSNLRFKIQKNWNPPDFAEDRHATIQFKVSRQGRVLSSEIVESSNNPVFDESILDALNKATPFEKFPDTSTREVLTIKYTFDTSIVKMSDIKEYVQISDNYYNVDNNIALEYINKAIKKVEGDINSYYLYGKRSKIKRALGDIQGAEADFAECKQLKAKFDKKRILNSKIIAEKEQSPYSYFYLAYSYDIAGNYEEAIKAIDKAIELTELNNQYKRYKAELLQKGNLQ